MEISAGSRTAGERAGLDSFEVRRHVLRAGGDLLEVSRALGVARNAVKYHVERANRLRPLRIHEGDPEDRAAMAVYQRKCLDRMGIAHD